MMMVQTMVIRMMVTCMIVVRIMVTRMTLKKIMMSNVMSYVIRSPTPLCSPSRSSSTRKGFLLRDSNS